MARVEAASSASCAFLCVAVRGAIVREGFGQVAVLASCQFVIFRTGNRNHELDSAASDAAAIDRTAAS